MRAFEDDLGRVVYLPGPPQRIVSLCPSVTETLFVLGAGPRVVGRTRYCVHPADDVSDVPVVGGTQDVDLEAVLRLRPELVIATREENRRETVDALAAAVPVYVVDVRSYEQALTMIQSLGALTGQVGQAAALVADISGRFSRMARSEGYTAAYLVWLDPCMVAGSGTYIHTLLERCGISNVCAHLPGRYPCVSLSELRRLSPRLLLLPSEPFPFSAQHEAALSLRFPDAIVTSVDGEMFGWYGARMRQAADYLREWLVTLGGQVPA